LNGYSAPIWMTFKQVLELGGCMRKGRHVSLVFYADRHIGRRSQMWLLIEWQSTDSVQNTTNDMSAAGCSARFAAVADRLLCRDASSGGHSLPRPPCGRPCRDLSRLEGVIE
jgi:hypothetical protein